MVFHQHKLPALGVWTLDSEDHVRLRLGLLDLQPLHPLRLTGNFFFGQAAAAMNLRPHHFAARHVEREDVDQPVAATAATDLDRRMLGKVGRKLLDPAFPDADAGVRVMGFSLKNVDADPLLILDDCTINAAGGRGQLGVLRD